MGASGVGCPDGARGMKAHRIALGSCGTRGQKTKAESGSLEIKADPKSWRTTLTLLGRKVEVESRDPRTMAEPEAGKAEMELEMGWRSLVESTSPKVSRGARGTMNPGGDGRMRYPSAARGMTGHGKAGRPREPSQERSVSMCGSPF